MYRTLFSEAKQITLIERLFWPARSMGTARAQLPSQLRTVLICVGGSLLLALSAQLKVVLPFTPVPITAQTLMVLLIGILLGPRLGAMTVALYLLQGALGLPFFSAGKGGLLVLFGPTGGYLWAFPLAAAATGWLTRWGWDRHWWSCATAMLIGNLIIYLSGLSWLTMLFSSSTDSIFSAADKAIQLGMLPFLVGDAIKIGVAMVLLPSLWRWIGDPNRKQYSG